MTHSVHASDIIAEKTEEEKLEAWIQSQRERAWTNVVAVEVGTGR